MKKIKIEVKSVLAKSCTVFAWFSSVVISELKVCISVVSVMFEKVLIPLFS